MFDSWDGKIWYPRFYDMDTICSYDNSGQIKFDVDIEMEQGYWNTSSSRLWTKIRDYMHDDLVEIYKDMRQNGLSFENLMKYFYDDQISVIPQTYYNKDADIKYIPYADQYIGKAHGDGYQHLKRWLKRRITFCDTLFDYTPSYTNDILTIRANTTEEMTLEIETYTPVYQHLSWYNNQMDKKKIDGKTSVTFTGTAQASTDQEVLIYGGSNIKAIRGISSMNPNQALIGSATRLTEIDLSNCPLLTTVNSDKANFTPHTYLNKLDISNCPQLGGILKVNNSPLLREINAKNTAVTGIQLPPSIRNLEVLRLPNTITSLTLNDAGLLNTLEFDEGVNLQSIALTNCNNLTNCINFDLTKTPTVLLDNSYNAEELYMSETTDLTLKNMATLKRVIYTPNDEYEEFNINNVINGSNYEIHTFNNPLMKEFITTAPHRLSYNNVGFFDKEIIDKNPNGINLLSEIASLSAGYISYETGEYMSGGQFSMKEYIEVIEGCKYTISSSQSGQHAQILFYADDKSYSMVEEKSYIKDDVCVFPYTFIIPKGYKYLRFHTNYDNISSISLEQHNMTIIQVKEYGDITPNTVFSANTLDLSDTQFTDIKLLCTTDLYNLKVPTTMKNFYCDSAMDIDTDVITDGSYEVIHDELVEQYTTNYSNEVLATKNVYTDYAISELEPYTYTADTWSISVYSTDYIDLNTSEITVIPTNIFKYCIRCYDNSKTLIKTYVEYGAYANSPKTFSIPNGTKYIKVGLDCNFALSYNNSYTPDIIPSSASGSLIFNLYSNNTTQPTSTSPYMWDLTGLKLNDFYTFGMNNWVKPNDGAIISVATEKVTIFPKNSWRGSLGNTVSIGVDNGSAFGAISPLKVKQGDSIKVNIQQSFKYAIIDSQGIILAETINTGTWSPIDTVVEVTQENADRLLIQAYPSGSPVSEVYFNDITFYTNTLTLTGNSTNDKTTAFSLVVESMDVKNQLCNLESITMPQRLPGYSVRMVNADITPNNYANHLYPLLVDTTLPITGKLDYSTYNGTSLAWAYAYTTNDVAITPLGSQQQGNITNDYNKLYGTDYVDIVDVWAYKDDDFSSKNTNEAITKAYIELTSSNYKTRIDEVLQWYPNCTDLYLFDDGSVTSLESMFYNNNTTYKTRIQNVTFIEGYFENVTKMTSGFYECSSLISITNIPNSITTYNSCFMNCTSLTTVSNIPNSIESSNTTFKNCSNLTSIPIDGWKGSLYQTFYNCTSLNQQINISSTTSLEGTFYGCSSLTTAPTIHDGVTNMSSTFSGCSALTTAPTIPDSVTNMSYTFQNCSLLTTAPTIPNSVTNMDSTFKNCTSLTTPPNIPNSVTNMTTTFSGCSKLTTAPTIPNSVTNIGWTFNGCTSLTTAPNIPNGVTNMSNTFYGCSSLTTVSNIPDGVTIMENTFRGCTSLTTAPNIPNSVKNMVYTFYGCSKLTECNIPLINLTAYTGCLNRCSSLTNIEWTGERTADFSFTTLNAPSYTQADIKELVPEHLGTVESATLTLDSTYGAYLSPDEVFLANKKGWTIEGASNDFTIINANDDVSGLTTDENVLSCFIELTQDNYTTRIDEVLQWYPNCTDIYLFDDGSVTSLVSMFNGSNTNTKNQIVKVEFMEGYFLGVNNMGNTFNNCSSLTTVSNIPDGVNNMASTFRGCSALTTAPTIPNGVTDMNNTFNGCSSLITAPNIPSGVTTMTGTFQNCSKLTTAPNIPSGVTNMYGTFYGCSSLTTIPNIPNSVTNMETTFRGCTALTTAPNIPDSVTTLKNTFNGCSSLTTAPNIPSSVTTMESTFNGCTSFTVIDTTDWDTSNVTNMSGLFYGCSNLTEIKGIENWNTSKVTNVWDLFYGCGSIEYIDLSKWDMSQMSSIGCMYRYCASLKVAYLPIYQGNPNNALQGCRADLDVVWVGERNTDFDLSVYTHTNGFRAIDIQELVPEHLDDLYKDTIKLDYSNTKININEEDSIYVESARYVEYIEGDGSGYIDTKIYANPQWKYEAIFDINVISGYYNLFGSDSTEFRLLLNANGYGSIISYNNKDYSNDGYNIGEKIKVTIDKNKYYTNDELKLTFDENTSTTDFIYSTLIFKARYGGRENEKPCKMKLYSFKMWDENGTLQFDGRPCLVDEKCPALYDEVSKKFFFPQS